MEGHTGVDHGRLVIEVRGAEPSPHLPPADSGWAAASPNTINLHPSSEWTITAAVRLEAWPAEPARGGPPDSDTSTIDASFEHPEIGARGFSAPGSETDFLHLGNPGHYQVRVHRWGGDQVDTIFNANPHDTIHRTENFLLQFWPSPADHQEVGSTVETATIPRDDVHAAIRNWAREL
ncbi:hypothetical protein H074_37058 [Amycolatopsis decaplanina DSM 44594]|uniref:Uncharacterized protein n=1 Tax=Amycolatopsis decaplanina DSM 44594 TaxID=1284240 RepID=M2XPS5_9PSEU|nr:hypothetical protein H074_37058 [Amycolatopsis decaplanina DSM 44594]